MTTKTMTTKTMTIKKWFRAIYRGEPTLTRGDYGERVESGRISPEGEVFVRDSTFGWTSWGSVNSPDWEFTGEIVPPCERDY